MAQRIASLMRFRLPDVSDISRFDVITEVIKVPYCLRSAGVVVIVVGNYFVAAFYEASGASTCNHGFNIPVETCAPPERYLSLKNTHLVKKSKCTAAP